MKAFSKAFRCRGARPSLASRWHRAIMFHTTFIINLAFTHNYKVLGVGEEMLQLRWRRYHKLELVFIIPGECLPPRARVPGFRREKPQ